MSDFDPQELRRAFGRFLTGVTIVTARAKEGTPVGFTANSFSSVSLEPPMVLVCPGKFLSSFEVFETVEFFTVSILADDQQGASNIFAGGSGDRFAQVAHHLDHNNVPVIDGAIATFSCRRHQAVPAGDHVVLIGEVTDFTNRPGVGLGYADGRYFSLSLEQEAAHSHTTAMTGGVIVEYLDGVFLEQTEAGYRPLQVTVSKHGDLRQALAAELARRGIHGEVRQVYSAFEDVQANRAGRREKFTYCLGTGVAQSPDDAISWVEIGLLPGLNFTTPAIADMMRRFAFEARSRDFSLYLGDARHGALHSSSTRT